MINSDPNKLTVTIAKLIGLFTGSVVVPESGKTVPIRGALLQKQNSGNGYFLGANQSGSVVVRPTPVSTEGQ